MALNYTNPMTTLTAVLTRICRGPVIGLCHGLFENLEFLKRFYRLEREEDLAVKYGGLNHFFWTTEVRTSQLDILADLRKRLRTKGFTDLLRASAPDPMGFKSNRELATELFRMTGVLPYLGDRHTCEFFPGYITNRKNMRDYKLKRTTIQERLQGREAQRKSVDRVWRATPDAETIRFFRVRSRETAADIIAAHSQGKVFIDVGNVPNQGQISNLPLGTVVETAVRVDRNGFSPINFGALPEPVLGLVEPCARVFNLGVEACFRGDKELALQALRLDPVCSHLTWPQVRQLGERLLSAHRGYLPKAWR